MAGAVSRCQEAPCISQSFPESRQWRDDELAEKWEKIRAVRRVVTGALEVERGEKRIGSSSRPRPRSMSPRRPSWMRCKGVDLAEVCITSAATLLDKAPEGAFTIADVPGVGVVPKWPRDGNALAPGASQGCRLRPSLSRSVRPRRRRRCGNRRARRRMRCDGGRSEEFALGPMVTRGVAGSARDICGRSGAKVVDDQRRRPAGVRARALHHHHGHAVPRPQVRPKYRHQLQPAIRKP